MSYKPTCSIHFYNSSYNLKPGAMFFVLVNFLISIILSKARKTIYIDLPYRGSLPPVCYSFKSKTIFSALLMSPTRELALQTFHEIRKFSKALKVRVVCVYGGTGISEQIAELKRGCEIIVCTPGRMIDMLTANSGKVTNARTGDVRGPGRGR